MQDVLELQALSSLPSSFSSFSQLEIGSCRMGCTGGVGAPNLAVRLFLLRSDGFMGWKVSEGLAVGDDGSLRMRWARLLWSVTAGGSGGPLVNNASPLLR